MTGTEFCIGANYGLYVLLQQDRKQAVRKGIMIAGVLLNLGVLGYFKYTDFLLKNINAVFRADIKLLQIAMPLGISFFTFQQISFIVDAYRGEVPKYSFIHYASFVAYFPQLIAGPIVTHDELVPQFMDESRKKPQAENIAKGLFLFSVGLSKKVLLADKFDGAVAYGLSAIQTQNSLTAILVMLGYTFQIYLDFSGYCDMAMGIAKMMNIDLPLNFDSPYKAKNMAEFWDRWHAGLLCSGASVTESWSL